jgi:hypothetical protein
MDSRLGQPAFVERRADTRINIDGYKVLVEFFSAKEHVMIENITRHGFFGKSETKVRADQKMLVRFPVIGGVLAEIVWQNNLVFGARFSEPIKPELFDILVDKFWHIPVESA